MREKKLEKLISRDRGNKALCQYKLSINVRIEELSDAIIGVLASIQPSFGSCVMVSSGLVAVLKTKYNISAVAVAGDLIIDGVKVFECHENLAIPNQKDEIIRMNWDGHCWVEVDGFICDLSIFRSAYAITTPSVLKNFILRHFGEGKGALLSETVNLPEGLEYIPKYVLKDEQISGFLAGLSYDQRN